MQPLLAKHGIVIVPEAHIIATVPSPAMKDGWQDVIMHVDWTIVGPDGSQAGQLIEQLGRFSEVGVQAAIGALIGVENIKPIEAMGRDVIPQAAKL